MMTKNVQKFPNPKFNLQTDIFYSIQLLNKPLLSNFINTLFSELNFFKVEHIMNRFARLFRTNFDSAHESPFNVFPQALILL